jgi:hypothetical protein
MDFNNKLMKRIWKNIDKDCEDGCWLSRYKTDTNGYCRIQIKGCLYKFHRVMLLWSDQTKVFEFNNGGIWLACHSCRNCHCVNPAHLRWGTLKDNMGDKIRDGTSLIGIKNGCSKLTEEQVLSIRREYEEIEEMTQQKLADKYGVSDVLIGFIIRRKIWTHI